MGKLRSSSGHIQGGDRPLERFDNESLLRLMHFKGKSFEPYGFLLLMSYLLFFTLLPSGYSTVWQFLALCFSLILTIGLH